MSQCFCWRAAAKWHGRGGRGGARSQTGHTAGVASVVIGLVRLAQAACIAWPVSRPRGSKRRRATPPPSCRRRLGAGGQVGDQGGPRRGSSRLDHYRPGPFRPSHVHRQAGARRPSRRRLRSPSFIVMVVVAGVWGRQPPPATHVSVNHIATNEFRVPLGCTCPLLPCAAAAPPLFLDVHPRTLVVAARSCSLPPPAPRRPSSAADQLLLLFTNLRLRCVFGGGSSCHLGQ